MDQLADKIYSVSEITTLIRSILEENFSNVTLEGEISKIEKLNAATIEKRMGLEAEMAKKKTKDAEKLNSQSPDPASPNEVTVQ